MIHLVRATRSDLSFIADLARKIWQETYVGNIGQDQVDYMLALFYSENVLGEKLDLGHDLYLIKDENKPVGYLHLEMRDEDYFINKFYIDNEGQRSGTGSRVMEMIISGLKPEDRPLRLHVNRKNFRAINFYFKNGFVIERLGDFDIGNGYYMNDFVMIFKGNN